jgi:hypothetical protein
VCMVRVTKIKTVFDGTVLRFDSIDFNMVLQGYDVPLMVLFPSLEKKSMYG